jgi:hypothetical protein
MKDNNAKSKNALQIEASEVEISKKLSDFLQTEDDGIDRLYQLYEETQKRVDELESNYLSTSYLKDKSTADILIELWRQSKEDSEI